MRRIQRRALAWALVLTLVWAALGGTPSTAQAQSPGVPLSGSPPGALAQLTQQAQQLTQAVQQIAQSLSTFFNAAAWLQQLVDLASRTIAHAQSAVMSEWGTEWGMAPDYAYSSSTVAQELQQLAASVGGSAAQWVAALARQLATAPAPHPGSPQASATVLASQDPDFATRSHILQQSQVAAVATQATAQSAAEQVQQVAVATTQDTTPQQDAQASAGVAREAGVALQTAPSTRAAVGVMGAALTQQQAYQQATLAAIASRLDALLTQQAQVALILAQAVTATGTASGLLAQQLEQQLEDQAQAAAAHGQTQVGAMSGVAAELQYLSQAPRDGTLDKFLGDLGNLQ